VLDSHQRADGITVGRGAAQMEPDRSIAGLIVPEEARRTVVRRHEQVDVPVAIEVAAGKTTRDLRSGEALSGGRGYVDERTVALIQEQLRGLCITDDSAHAADRFVDVTVCDDEIELAVEIQIREHAAEAERMTRSLTDP